MLLFYPRRIMRIRYNVWHYSPVAQSVERLAVNQLVAGSSPARGASWTEVVFGRGNDLCFFVGSVCRSKARQAWAAQSLRREDHRPHVYLRSSFLSPRH